MLHHTGAVKVVRDTAGWCACGKRGRWHGTQSRVPLTQTKEGVKEEPEEAEDGGGQGLVHSGKVDPLLQLGREVSKVEVVAVHHMLQQDVDEACERGAVS